MPRLDNSDPVILRDLAEIARNDETAVEFEEAAHQWEAGEDLSGQVTPADVCRFCFRHFFRGQDEIPHPDYEDDDYRCVACGDHLTNDDN